MTERSAVADRVNTREAARMYGVTETTFLKFMRETGVKPTVVRRFGRKGRPGFWWIPEEVIKERTARYRKLQDLTALYDPTDKVKPHQYLGRLVRSHIQLERQRNRRLAPIAAKRGMTVKELRIDLGIDKP